MLLLFATILSIILTGFCFYLNVEWYYLILIFISGYFIATLLIFIYAILLSLIFGKKECIITPKKVFNRLTYHACKAVMMIYRIKIIKVGLDLIENPNYLFICNHQSNYDPLIALSVIKKKGLTFIMKEEIMKVPIIGRYLFSSGFFPLNRNNNREGLKTIIHGIHAIEANRPMGVFIEGTRSKGPNINEFKSGAFKIAYKACCDIVICVIDNTYNIIKRFPLKTTVLFQVCKVLKYEQFKDLTTKELEVIVRNEMEMALNEARSKYTKLKLKEIK